MRYAEAMRSAVLIIFLISSAAMAQQANPDTLFKKAFDAQQQGDYATAIQNYRKLLKVRPELGEAHANLGAALAHTGQFDEAIAQYKLALTTATEKDSIRLDIGLAYYKKGDLVNAAHLFEDLRTRRPRDPQLAILLGDSDVKLGHANEAVAVLTPLEAENASNPDFEYALGEAQIASGERRAGAERLGKVAAATQSADAYLLAGSTLLDLNENEIARTDLDAAVHLNPSLPHIFTLDGIARDKTGEHDAAEPMFREALKQDPNDFEANLYLGAILYKRRALDEARPLLDKALQLKPQDEMAEYESAMWESTAGKYEEAARQLEAVTKRDPAWLDPHIELATVYYRLHRPEDGAKQRAIITQLNAQQQSKGPGKP
jgi:tetratricopeptide (TPR) repeat protein